MLSLHCILQQGVALTGRNRTGQPCSVRRPTANAPGPPARRQRYKRRQRQTMTDASEQNNTGPLGGRVEITIIVFFITVIW